MRNFLNENWRQKCIYYIMYVLPNACITYVHTLIIINICQYIPYACIYIHTHFNYKDLIIEILCSFENSMNYHKTI